MTPLRDVKEGIPCTIREIRMPLSDQLHMVSLGLYPSAVICKIRKTPFGDPVEYLVDHDLLITVENAIADRIWVAPT